MTADFSYDENISKQLKQKFQDINLHRPMHAGRYDAGEQLKYKVTGVATPGKALVELEIEKFVGGGFAGQVYRVKVVDITPIKNAPANSLKTIPLEKGNIYALKVLIPPSGFSRIFRNLVYRIGFQAPFQPQVNPDAARAGALWQKFIRKGAGIRFGNEQVVNDIHVTLVDEELGSCGEISDWVDGRTWRLEVDDRMDLLSRFKHKKQVDASKLNSPEYRAKKKFMTGFVQLLHDMGGSEFARQYEWSTAKSQPNCLKLKSSANDPEKGLVAVDFRAGLALLPFLPMSPGDIKLIFKGLGRGSLVQFDRGNLKKLEAYIAAHADVFNGMETMFEELKSCEKIYRDSIPDITHNHFRLLYSRKLWSTILKSFRTSWRVRNIIDHHRFNKLKSVFSTLLFSFLGAIPFLGGFIRKLWGRADMRKHYGNFFSSFKYMRSTFRGKNIERTLNWYRAGRLEKQSVLKTSGSTLRCLLHLPLSILPVGLHRMLTKWQYFQERLFFIFVRPIKLYFSAPMREQWLKDMVAHGEAKQMLTPEDAAVIHSQINEPFIQKYLKSLAVHVCTLPVTQIVSIIVSWIYVKMNPALTTAEATAAVAAILVLFQITPVSPGSLVRGIYVVALALKERNYKDYNIALFLSFFKYIGYLAFPIQMTYRYPELARFMAGHWATEAVHIVPVFGESGALLEHWVYGLFYNWPLTIRRRMTKRAELRASIEPRYIHLPLLAILGAAILAVADYYFIDTHQVLPIMKLTWWFIIPVPFIAGLLFTLWARGAALSRRIIFSPLLGMLLAVFHTASTFFILTMQQISVDVGELMVTGFWRLFVFAVFATLATVLTELRLPDPQLRK